MRTAKSRAIWKPHPRDWEAKMVNKYTTERNIYTRTSLKIRRGRLLDTLERREGETTGREIKERERERERTKQGREKGGELLS